MTIKLTPRFFFDIFSAPNLKGIKILWIQNVN